MLVGHLTKDGCMDGPFEIKRMRFRGRLKGSISMKPVGSVLADTSDPDACAMDLPAVRWMICRLEHVEERLEALAK